MILSATRPPIQQISRFPCYNALNYGNIPRWAVETARVSPDHWKTVPEGGDGYRAKARVAGSAVCQGSLWQEN